MRVGYIECFAGISGDMLLGALVDAGVSRELLTATVEALGLGAELRFTTVDRSGIRATKVDVMTGGELAEAAVHSGHLGHSHAESHAHSHPHDHDQPHAHDHGHSHSHNHSEPGSHSHSHSHSHSETQHSHGDEHSHSHAHAETQHLQEEGTHTHVHGRGLSEIRSILRQSGMPPKAEALAIRAFEMLGEAEAKIHNTTIEEVHFHEVGAVDAIVDIACAAAGLTALEVDQWVCSSLNIGGGFVDCAHGRFPVPAPATADLLRGAPTYSSGIQMELVTPTGAALLRALGCSFSSAPPMRVATIGYGAGTRNPKRFPNVLRLSLGESAAQEVFPSETIVVLECAVDDLSPQVVAHAAQLALDRGALDVMSSAVQMKKGRIGTLLTVLCRKEQAADFEALLFRETSTLGIRKREEQRVYLDRRSVEVQTEYGLVRIKLGSANGEQFNAMPEYEDCRRIAAERGIALKQIVQAALAALAESRVQA